MLEAVVVGVVGEGAAVREALVSPIEAAGASALACTEATALAGSAAVDALVFDVGAAPERFVPVALVLAGDPRTRHVPRVLVVAGDVAAERIAPFGAAVVVALASPVETLAGAIADAVMQVRARSDAERRVQKVAAERRAIEQQVARLREDAGTLSHDARVLFGVILGYAGNMRDGIAGPISDVQRAHVASIIEASSDAGALLDRYLGALRRAVAGGEGAEPPAELAPRQPRRRQTDVGELVRTTVVLFGGVAAARQIRITAEVARALSPAWCDAMQIKQALVNLLSNALKFTPAGGAVELAVRSAAPASARGGAAARRELEIVVSDTGPGIPLDQRERVFERGVRLERDRRTPGTGIGLAVVREVVEQHGGAVRIDDAPSGGASIVLTLPTDLRARASDRPRAVHRALREDSE